MMDDNDLSSDESDLGSYDSSGEDNPFECEEE
jgi:hypothetical protein